MEKTNVAVIEHNEPSTMNNTSLLLNIDVMDRMMKLAEVMSQGVATVPKHLQGRPSDCLAIIMQAARWGMDPFVVGQKTHLVNGALGYEAQLYNALITSSKVVHGRFKYEYGGDWEKIVGKKDGRDESGLFVRVGAVLRGETEVTWGEPIYLADITTRNSPLWKTAPKQQIGYLAVKYWARTYCPEVTMGIYDKEDLEQRTEREINPVPAQRMSVKEITSEVDITASAQESATNVDALADEIRERIDTSSTVDQAKAIRADIESQKALLGTALFTELKNKAVKRYYLVDHRNKVEAAINSLPNPGEPDAAELFAKAESALTAARRHLGDELYDLFRITLDDMKPEYIG
ncbi:enterohemolysin [Escherichia coli]|uniref:RecT family recombinase n=1 Tax=Escherichia coli TaxID=562 RepID=UPI00128E4446|nr:recombinase RecT [Escherichia coli]MPU29088.1 enterohemolysin [Escherichia coli]MPU39505.1 enterohemolysin [Escherichia coli]